MSYEKLKLQRNQVRGVVCDATVDIDERWDRMFTENFQNMKMFWKEVNRLKKKKSWERGESKSRG